MNEIERIANSMSEIVKLLVETHNILEGLISYLVETSKRNVELAGMVNTLTMSNVLLEGALKDAKKAKAMADLRRNLNLADM